MTIRSLAVIVCIHFAVSPNSRGQKTDRNYNETKLRDFVVRTREMGIKNALTDLELLLGASSKDSLLFCRIVTFLETPFDNPNSPYRDDELLARLLEAKVKSRWIGDAEKDEAENKHRLLQQNKVGYWANDFVYVAPDGSRRRLYDLSGSFTLLLFYNPECHSCEEIKLGLTYSPLIKAKISSGELKILAIFPDRNKETWLKHLPAMPKEWIHGRDEEEYLYKNRIYDLRAIPTAYLLDKEKKILLKDCQMIAKIEEELASKRE